MSVLTVDPESARPVEMPGDGTEVNNLQLDTREARFLRNAKAVTKKRVSESTPGMLITYT